MAIELAELDAFPYFFLTLLLYEAHLIHRNVTYMSCQIQLLTNINGYFMVNLTWRLLRFILHFFTFCRYQNLHFENCIFTRTETRTFS